MQGERFCASRREKLREICRPATGPKMSRDRIHKYSAIPLASIANSK
jgi:hypothetical protein